MRAELVVSGKAAFTPVKDLKVYGHISGAEFWTGVIPTLLTCPGTVSNGVNSYPYFTAWGIGCWGSATLPFATGTSCRQLVLDMMSTDNASGDPSSSGVSTVTLTQETINQQSVSFDDNVLSVGRFALDGSRGEIQVSNSNYSPMYFLQDSYADCLTPTGN